MKQTLWFINDSGNMRSGFYCPRSSVGRPSQHGRPFTVTSSVGLLQLQPFSGTFFSAAHCQHGASSPVHIVSATSSLLVPAFASASSCQLVPAFHWLLSSATFCSCCLWVLVSLPVFLVLLRKCPHLYSLKWMPFLYILQ